MLRSRVFQDMERTNFLYIKITSTYEVYALVAKLLYRFKTTITRINTIEPFSDITSRKQVVTNYFFLLFIKPIAVLVCYIFSTDSFHSSITSVGINVGSINSSSDHIYLKLLINSLICLFASVSLFLNTYAKFDSV